MATYLKALELLGKGGLKRLYFVYGPDRPLVEDVVDRVRVKANVSDFDYVSTSPLSQSEREIWASANTYPLEQGARRLVVVRDADRMLDRRSLMSFLETRHLPLTTLLMVSEGVHDPTKMKDLEREAWLRMQKTGQIVKCGPSSEESVVDFLETTLEVQRGTARQTAEILRGDMTEAMNLASKVRHFSSASRERAMIQLCEPSPARRFAESLLTMKKDEALTCLPAMSTDDCLWSIGELDWLTDQASRAHRAANRHMTRRDQRDLLDVKPWLFKILERSAKHYDRERYIRCVGRLARADTVLRRGDGTGVMEMLVAGW